MLTAKPTKLSCNERMKHGPSGIAYGGTALVGAWSVLSLAGKFKESFKKVDVNASWWKKMDHYGTPFCAMGALGLVSYYFATKSIESLTIFFTDDDEPASKNSSSSDTTDAQDTSASQVGTQEEA